MCKNGAQHGAGEQGGSGESRAWNQHKESAKSFYPAGEVAEPVAPSDFGEDGDPFRSRARGKFLYPDREKECCKGDPQHPISNGISLRIGRELWLGTGQGVWSRKQALEG